MVDIARTDGRAQNPLVHHEPSDVNVRVILWFGAGLVVAAVVIHVALWWMLGYYAGREAREKRSVYPLAAAERGQLPPAPILEGFDPGHKVGILQPSQGQTTQVEAPRLHSYGWVDKDAGIVHIPIARAMRLMENNLPVRPEGGER
jgi:hypothetical protein